jgi:hypothetical protein
MTATPTDIVRAADLPIGQALVHWRYGTGVLTAFDAERQRMTVLHDGERGERVYALEVKGMFKLSDGRYVDGAPPWQIGAAPDVPTAPLLEKLEKLIGEWEHMAFALNNCIFYSMRGFCTDVYVRHDIFNTLEALEKKLSPLPRDWMHKITAADEQFRAATQLTAECMVDWWQDELVRRAEEPWPLWICGSTNPQDHWYLYREPG